MSETRPLKNEYLKCRSKSSDDLDLIEDKLTEEAAYAIRNPSYKDLVDENAYLRLERSQLYDELARVSQQDTSCKVESPLAQIIKALEGELFCERAQNTELLSHFEYLKGEIAHLLTTSSRRSSRTSGIVKEKEKERSMKVLYYREYKRKSKKESAISI